MNIMNKLFVILAGASALAASAAGFAGGPESHSKSFENNSAGFYVEGDAMFYGSTDLALPSNNGFTWYANMGYQFGPHFAVEAGYLHLFDGYRHAVTFDAKGIYPISPLFNLFGK